MWTRLPAAALVALLLAATLTGCGSSATSSPVAGTVASSLIHLAPPETLAAQAVRYLPSSVKPLSVSFLARESGSPLLRAQLPAWGFIAGADRYFQGESRELQVVDSRTLRFRSAAGATSFVQFMRDHLSSYLGSLPRIRHYQTLGRTGILAVGQPCACHLANPAYLAIVARGPTVTWLEINGPGATPKALGSLIARAP
jgi:hypothetical protein